jgi:hypothetical protein
MPRTHLVRGCGAPVLAIDVEPIVAERSYELNEVGRHGAHVVAGVWVHRVADAVYVGRNAGIVGGQEGHDFAPVVGCLGDAVLEEERQAGTRDVVV